MKPQTKEERIAELEIADATLNADGYKTWCQVRLAISSAIISMKEDIKILNERNSVDEGEKLTEGYCSDCCTPELCRGIRKCSFDLAFG